LIVNSLANLAKTIKLLQTNNLHVKSDRLLVLSIYPDHKKNEVYDMNYFIKTGMARMAFSSLKFLTLFSYLLVILGFSACTSQEVDKEVEMTQAELAASISFSMDKLGIRLCGPDDGKLIVWSLEQSLMALNLVEGAAEELLPKLKDADLLVGAVVQHLDKNKTWIFAKGWDDSKSFVVGPLMSAGNCQRYCPSNTCSGKQCVVHACYVDCGESCASECSTDCNSNSDCEGTTVKFPAACKEPSLEDFLEVNTTPARELVPGTSLWSR